jgi:tetratricopeptide (TPR) repeat protein
MTDVISTNPTPPKGNNGHAQKADPEPMRVANELAGLRREVLEARNLVIKTDNLLKTFHIELKAIGTKQQSFERRHFIGHVAAYAVIGLLAAGGAVFFAKAAGEASRTEAERLLGEAQQSSARAAAAEKEATTLLKTRDAAASEALAAYELLRSKERAEQEQGLEKITAVGVAKLDPFSRSVLEREASELRNRLAGEAYGSGMADYRRGKLKESAAALEQYLGYAKHMPPEEQKDERSQALYYLGATYNQIGQHGDATTKLEAFLAGASAGETAAYAALLLGDSLQASGRKDDAKKAFERGLKLGASGHTQSALTQRLTALSGG